MRMRRLGLLPLGLWAASTCRADITIGDPPNWAVNIAIFAPTGQSFTADSPTLKSIGMWIDSPGLFQLTLLNGSGLSGTQVATRTATSSGGYGFLDFDFTGVTLTVGQAYTAMMTQISPPTGTGTGIHGVKDVYSGGIAFISGQPRPDLDFSLRVRSIPSIPALEYAAKFVCGQPKEEESEHGRGMVAAGMYFTVLNLHNPAETEIQAKMKVATAKPNAQPGNISPFLSISLNTDQAMAVDCSQIHKLANDTSPFLEGFVVVESDVSLDVVAVYTGGQHGKLETFGTERVPERKMH